MVKGVAELSWLKSNGYEVTERGKITAAIVIVLLLFIIPAIIITAFAWSNPAHSPENPPQINDPDPIINNTPLPDGSGFNPDDPAENGYGEQGEYNPPPETPAPPEPSPTPSPEEIPAPPDQPQETGPVSINRSAGTMSFMFSPEKQDALDADTVSMIADFITSPRNTSNSQVSAEIPVLSNSDTSVLKSAITEAFAEHGISQSRISFATYQSDSSNNSFEVKLSFIASAGSGSRSK